MKLKSNIIKKAFVIFITSILLCSVCCGTVFADYYNTGNELQVQYTPDAFSVKQIIGNFNDIGQLSSPSDLFIDAEDNIYILDAGNRRVVKVDENGKILKVYSGAYNGLEMNSPQGLFVDPNDASLYIADTENKRVIHIGADGKYIEQFTQPKEDTYDKEYGFRPMKVAVDDLGRIYVSNKEDYHGLITIDGDNKFLGYIAATKVGFDLTEKFYRIFASEEQRKQQGQIMPEYFSNFLIAPNGFIYGTSYWSKTNQIKKLTPSGNNVYPEKLYGEENSNTVYMGRPALVDLAVDKSGIVYVADYVTKKVFVYDQEGNNLVTFGGRGKRQYNFDSISAIGINSKNELLVLDDVTNCIQIFEPTEIMQNVIAATTLYNDGKYEEAREPWEKVLSFDNTHNLAMMGLAKSDYRAGNYQESLERYVEALDKKGYSEVFYDYRVEIFRDNFFLVVILALVLLIALVFVIGKIGKYAKRIVNESLPNDRFGLRDFGRLMVMMIYHPLDGFEKIKQNRKRLKIWPLVVLGIAIAVVRVANIYMVHFPLASTSAQFADLWQQVAIFYLPLLSWVVIGFALSSISDGKQTFKESVAASLYSFVPYIVLTLPVSLLSHVMCQNELIIYTMLSTGVLVWSIILLLLSNKVMNEYTFGKLVWHIFKTLFGIICLWMIAFLFFIVLNQFWTFIKEISNEFSLIQNMK